MLSPKITVIFGEVFKEGKINATASRPNLCLSRVYLLGIDWDMFCTRNSRLGQKYSLIINTTNFRIYLTALNRHNKIVIITAPNNLKMCPH